MDLFAISRFECTTIVEKGNTKYYRIDNFFSLVHYIRHGYIGHWKLYTCLIFSVHEIIENSQQKIEKKIIEFSWLLWSLSKSIWPHIEIIPHLLDTKPQTGTNLITQAKFNSQKVASNTAKYNRIFPLVNNVLTRLLLTVTNVKHSIMIYFA